MAFEHEAGQLRRIARRATVFYTDHGDRERKNDHIEKIDIANMLGRCSVTLIETNKESGEQEWRAEGTDSDGRKITAVVVVYDKVAEIKVVTAWANKQ